MAHTMKEVAKQAGVSPATVSRVLNKTQFISTKTKQRVLDAVHRLNYVKNVHARRLATGQSDLFGLVISEISNPYFPEIIRGFQTAAWSRGRDVLLFNNEYDQSRTMSIVQKLIESDVRGVAIMTASVDKSVASDLIAAGIGVVFCNIVRGERLVSNISIDYQQGISQAIEHVVELGHRSAAVIAGPEDNHTAIIIKQGLVNGLKARELNPYLVLESNYRVDAGASSVRTILSQPEIPTVIFCGSDLIAMGAMSALEDAGVKVPDDISVIGIDDISFGIHTRHPLTTIHVPREQLGAIAFEALDKMLKTEKPERCRVLSSNKVGSSQIHRSGSTAPPRSIPCLRLRKRQKVALHLDQLVSWCM